MFKNLSIFFSIIMFCSQAFAKDNNEVVFAHDCTWPPMEFINADQDIVGFDVDYSDAVAKEMGVKAKHVNVSWDGIFAGIEMGKYDVIASSVTISPKRQRNMDFSVPYMTVRNSLLTNDAWLPKTEKELRKAKGKKIGVQIGTEQYLYLTTQAKGVDVRTYTNIALAIEDLDNERLDGVLGDDYLIKHLLSKKPEFAAKFRIPLIFPQGQLGFVVKKGNTELLGRLNKAILSVQKKGIDKTLEKKWFGE